VVKESAPASTAQHDLCGDHCPITCHEKCESSSEARSLPDCGGKLKHLGEDVSEILEYVPASLKVIQYIRPKLACASCDRIVQAQHRADRSSEALLALGFWRMS